MHVPNVNRLLDRLGKPGRDFAARAELFGGGALVAGRETVRPERAYDWDGLRRGADPKRPAWLFQYTLRGWGVLETRGAVLRVPAEAAFLVRLPSAHRYHAAADCPEWEFFWMLIEQPEVDARLARHRNLRNVVIPPGETAEVARQAAAVLEAAHFKREDFDVEAALFDWMIGMERRAFARMHPPEPRQRLLDTVRRMLLERLDEPLRIDALADAFGMSRSNFAHHFQRTTGAAPAEVLRGLRLDEAARLLREGRLSVKEVAATAGFPNVSHFCRLFRRHFGVPRGAWRRHPVAPPRPDSC